MALPLRLHRGPRSAAILLIVLCLSAPARAQDEDSFDRDLSSCRRLSEQKKWPEALAAWDRFFADHEGDSRAVGQRLDIADEVLRVRFSAGYREPGPAEFFGEAVKSFGTSSRKIRLEYDARKERRRWQNLEGELAVLDLRFESKVTIEVPDSLDKGQGVLVAFNIEAQSGYVVVPAAMRQTPYDGSIWCYTSVLKLFDGKATSVAEGFHVEKELRVVCDRNSIRVYEGKTESARAKEPGPAGGYSGFLGGVPAVFTIEGVMERAFWAQILGEHRDQALRTFREKEWDPSRHLPAWLREPEAAATGPSLLALPPDAKEVDAARITALAEGCLCGDPGAAVGMAAAAADQTGRTAEYLRALADIGGGRLKDAEAALGRVADGEPSFPPARVYRGLIRLMLRRLDGAREDFEAALAADPKLDRAWVGLVAVAMADGDLDAAEARLADAAKSGVRSADLSDLTGSIQRARRGPLWTLKGEIVTTHFEIQSDHSRELCREVAHTLEAAFDAYEDSFPDVEVPRRKARVWLFATQEGFLGYAKDRLQNLEFAAGAYDPKMRELVLFLPVDRSNFTHTIRHEGFHRFVHEVIETAPPWFNEGCAEYFAAPGDVLPHAVETLRTGRKDLFPVDRLVRMSHADFMRQNPRVAYAQSWALVRCLMLTKERLLRGRLRQYLGALREGLSAEEAWDKVFEPVRGELVEAFLAHLGEIL